MSERSHILLLATKIHNGKNDFFVVEKRHTGNDEKLVLNKNEKPYGSIR